MKATRLTVKNSKFQFSTHGFTIFLNLLQANNPPQINSTLNPIQNWPTLSIESAMFMTRIIRSGTKMILIKQPENIPSHILLVVGGWSGSSLLIQTLSACRGVKWVRFMGELNLVLKFLLVLIYRQ